MAVVIKPDDAAARATLEAPGAKVQAQIPRLQTMIDNINSGKNLLAAADIKQTLLDMMDVLKIIVAGGK